MALIRRGFVLATGLAAGLVTSQAPEFAQQYRQRLGGAIDELRKVVTDFDDDAARSKLSRQQALERYQRNKEAFFQDRGTSMRSTIERYDQLSKQAGDFAQLPAFARPLALLESRDRSVAENAWRDYEPAVPVTPHGLGWAAIGLVAGGLVAWLFTRLTRWGWRERPRYGRKGAMSRS